jgi:hypothetical protein
MKLVVYQLTATCGVPWDGTACVPLVIMSIPANILRYAIGRDHVSSRDTVCVKRQEKGAHATLPSTLPFLQPSRKPQDSGRKMMWELQKVFLKLFERKVFRSDKYLSSYARHACRNTIRSTRFNWKLEIGRKTSVTVQSPMLDSKKCGYMLINLRHIYEVIYTDKTSAFFNTAHIDAANYTSHRPGNNAF